MTRVTVRPTDQAIREVRTLSNFMLSLANPSAFEMNAVGVAVQREFKQSFLNQGSAAGAWRPLQPWTQSERAWLGYHPTYPILFRDGHYMDSFMDSSSVHEYRETPTGWEMEFGSNDFRHSELEGGRSSPTVMSARPVTLLADSQEARLGTALDALFMAKQVA